uniref:Probable pectate lyase F n=1 Tax=Ditylenchus dipsaci TaxID=166011 RepID=A0A915DTC6_9BILA
MRDHFMAELRRLPLGDAHSHTLLDYFAAAFIYCGRPPITSNHPQNYINFDMKYCELFEWRHNGVGTVYIKNFQVEDFSKLYQACGTCPAMTRKVVQSAIRAKGRGLALAGIMAKNGDTATFTNIQVDSKVSYICQRYNDGAGTSKAGQYTAKENGDGTQCKYSTSNIQMI